MSQRQRDQVKEYFRQLRINRERLLGTKMCREIAAAVAKEKFRLEPDEQQEVDAWLDEKEPERLGCEDEPIEYPPMDAPRVT